MDLHGWEMSIDDFQIKYWCRGALGRMYGTNSETRRKKKKKKKKKTNKKTKKNT